MSNAIENGAKQAVVNCLKVRSGENVVIVTDRDTEKLGGALKLQAENVGAEVQMFVMENYGDRPDDGNNPIQFPSEIGNALKGAQVSFYIAQGKKGELQSFRIPMIKEVEANNIRHGHMPNFIEDMMSQGMASDYAKIQEISKKVYDIASKAKEIHVTTSAGTDVTAKFDQKFKWIICDGNIQPGAWSNLPDGEVFSVPVDVNGKVVIDGCLGDFFNKKYGDLSGTPVSYDVKDGRCIKGSVTCSNEKLKNEFEEYTFNTDENSNRVGEFAIGTNIGLNKLICNLLQDEKFPGVHIALGDAYSDKTGAEWTSQAHNDGVMRNVTIEVDGKKIMENSKFLI
ncbi:MAG: aminopeptidase [Deltaproteobacteria bacterium]|jgi:aminopeptidase|nr:aminopeptidase [Deltaproteobacteria bacterium]